MIKNFLLITIVLLCLTSLNFAQEISPEKGLNYFVGEWRSKGVSLITREESVATSIVEKVIGDKWLMWTFTGEVSWSSLEVVTLINFDDIKKRYAFYSYNPVDEEPIPHFGDWVDEKLLRIETDFGGENVRVDFIIKDDNNFCQEHSRLDKTGRRYVTSRTDYSRITD